MLGGRWVGSIVATEETREVPIDFLKLPNLGLPAGLTGNEPVGSIVRSVESGNPLQLVQYNLPFAVPQPVRPGWGSTNLVTENQGVVETGEVVFEGIVSNAVLRVKQPFLGRVVLSMRYPLENSTPEGCLQSRRFAIDFQHTGPISRIQAAATPTGNWLRVRLPAYYRCQILVSRDLQQWQVYGSYIAGFYGCLDHCDAYRDLDNERRAAEFDFSLSDLVSTGANQPVFVKLVAPF